MKDSNAGVFCCIFIAYLAGTIVATIIDEEQLEIGEGLSYDAIDAAVQVLLGIIYGDDDGDFGHGLMVRG